MTHRLLLRAFSIIALLLFMPACTAMRGGTPVSSPEQMAMAGDIYERLVENQEAGNFAAAAVNAREIINAYQAFPLIDEVTLRAGQIAEAQEQWSQAATYYDAVSENYPTSPGRADALLGASRAYEHLGQSTKSAERVLAVLELPINDDVREAATTQLRTLVRTRIGPDDLAALATKYPSSALNQEIAVELARKEYARGNYDKAYELLGEFLYRFPDQPEASEARLLLRQASERRQPPRDEPASVVDPNHIGVVLPVTGPGSLYGRLFAQGVDKAVAEFNANGNRTVTVVKADSKGDPVGAARAVRKLVQEAGAIAILGSVFTVPTIAAGVEANSWRVPFLSPVVSNDDLLEIGPWVYHTKVPLAVEVSAMATMAVENLGIERFAVIAPDRGPRRKLADLFADQVRAMGGDVVAEAYYEGGATDYREQVELVREAAPDAIFAPGTVEELVLLLPQVKFYDLQVQLLGLSDWNSDKLLRLFRAELEGALFPVEAYHGKDPAEYERFKSEMLAEGAPEVSPVSVSGYFGARMLLDAIAGGAASRDDIRRYLDTELRSDADGRMKEARSLSMVTVRGGRVREFRPPPARKR